MPSKKGSFAAASFASDLPLSRARERGTFKARKLDCRPGCIPVGRPRGAKAEGLRYEKSLRPHLESRFSAGQWWEYEKNGRKKFCQTDFWAIAGERVIILEVKLTWCDEAEEQLDLYRRVLLTALGLRSALVVVVCKHLVQGLERYVSPNLQGALRYGMENPGVVPVWHHIGGQPLLLA